MEEGGAICPCPAAVSTIAAAAATAAPFLKLVSLCLWCYFVWEDDSSVQDFLIWDKTRTWAFLILSFFFFFFFYN